MNKRKRERNRIPDPVSTDSQPHLWRLCSSQELLCLGAIFVLAIAIRGVLPSRIAVEHFDSGVYASNVFFHDAIGSHYPARHLYAPPLHSWLVEAAIIGEVASTGRPNPSAITPVLPNLLIGCLTVLLVYVAARIWFGVPVGMATASIAACSDLHVLMSRTALTDVMLLFWCIAAVVLFERSVTLEKLWIALCAGVATALAWWTKYNGWLPLAITFSGVCGMLLFVPSKRTHTKLMLKMWAAMATVAILAWIPCLIGLQSVGGYSAVAVNHAKYVHGISGWWTAAGQHYAYLRLLDSPLVCIGFALMAWFLGDRLPRNGRILFALFVASVAWLIGSFVMLALLSAIGISQVFRRAFIKRDDSKTLPSWLLMSWIAGLSVATPMYHSYPRLALTWIGVSWFLASLGALAAIDLVSDRVQHFQSRKIFTVSMVVTGGLLVIAIFNAANRGISWRAYDQRTGLMQAAQKMAATCAARVKGQDVLVSVYGEPALFYQLRTTGKVLAIPTLGNSFLNTNQHVFLAVGPHAIDSDEFKEFIAKYRDYIRPLETFTFRSSTHGALDQFTPAELIADDGLRQQEVVLYVTTAHILQ